MGTFLNRVGCKRGQMWSEGGQSVESDMGRMPIFTGVTTQWKEGATKEQAEISHRSLPWAASCTSDTTWSGRKEGNHIKEQ